MTVIFALTAAVALANEHLTQIRDHARQLEQDFQNIQSLVKNKNFDTADLQSRLGNTSESVAKLKTLMNEFESSSPHLTNTHDWKTTKDMATLIEIFHAQKIELASGDTRKNRAMLKSHAEGLAKRAALLHRSADNLAKTAGS
jgi:hypothetical protein